MNRVTWKHAVAGMVLLATLALVAPAPAQATVLGAGGHDSWSGGWTWMAFLWDRLAMIFGVGQAPPAPAGARPRGIVQKSTTDNGGGTAWADNGSMINPDGQP
jgi:hypothetical protein